MLSQTLQAAVLSPPTIVDPGNTASVIIAVKFTGPAVDASSFGDGNFLAEGPGGFKAVAGYAGLSPQDPGAGHGYRIADYVVNVGTDSFTPAEDGAYSLDPQPDQVKDDQLGFLLPTAPIHAFDVNVHYVYPISATVDGQPLASGGSVDFGSTDTAFPGGIKTLTLTNTLSESLTFSMDSGAMVMMPLGGSYAMVGVIGQSGTNTYTLAAGASRSFQLQFNLSPGSNLYAQPGQQSSTFTIFPASPPDVHGIQNFTFGVSGAYLLPADSPLVNLAGTVYNDANGNDQADPGETGISGIMVYVDLNNNGTYDPATEPSFISQADGSYDFNRLPHGNYVLREIVPQGWAQTFPTDGSAVHVSADSGGDFTNLNFFQQQNPNGTISGVLYNDLNQNGQIDSGDNGSIGQVVFLDLNNNRQLDPTEPFATTDAGGHYSFSVHPSGQFYVRLQLRPGWTQIVPALGAARAVYVSSNANFDGNDFLLHRAVAGATISGTVFNDANADQTVDNSETGMAGVSVYIDSNSNGYFDPGEPSVMTDSKGAMRSRILIQCLLSRWASRSVLTSSACSRPMDTARRRQRRISGSNRSFMRGKSAAEQTSCSVRASRAPSFCLR